MLKMITILKKMKKIFTKIKTSSSEAVDTLKYKTVHMTVDKQLIEAQAINADGHSRYADVQKIIEPLWWSVSIYDGEEKYENDLKPFTTPQRNVFAIQWYSAEVINGGHDQFYYNSTGIVWEDALKGFQAIEAWQNADIIKESAKRMGGKPSKDRKKRQKKMDKLDPDFEDLDDLYYESEESMIQLLDTYIRNHAEDFVFSGEVTVPKGFMN